MAPTNMSIQPGSATDPMDHEADSGHNSGYTPGRAEDAYEDYLVKNKRPGDREVPARSGKSDSERKDQSRYGQ